MIGVEVPNSPFLCVALTSLVIDLLEDDWCGGGGMMSILPEKMDETEAAAVQK